MPLKPDTFLWRLFLPFGASILLLAHPATAAAPSPDDQAKLGALKKQVDELDHAGKLREAIPIEEQRVELSKKALGPENTETLNAIHDLAAIYCKTDNFAKAEPLCQSELKTCEKVFGPDDPMTANALTDVAVYYEGKRDYATAAPLYQRALAIREKKLGPEHVDVGEALRYLAWLYGEMGDFAKATPVGERALKIYEKVDGPNGVETAAALSVLGELYFDAGNYAKATELCDRALKIREEALGPNHPDTAESINNRGLIYFTAGDYNRAVALFQRALAISEKAFGPDHFYTTSCLNNLGFVYRALGEFSKSEPFYRRALESRERVLTPLDQDLAISLNNLASLVQDEGNNSETEALYQRALKIRETALGPDHPDTARSLNDLAGLYIFMGDYAKAEPLFQRAAKIFEKVFGTEHPEAMTSLNNLGLLYEMSHQYDKAEPLFQRVLKTREKIAGPDDVDTAMVLSNLGVLYWETGDYTKATSYTGRALKIREEKLGPRHPKTAESLHNEGNIYRDCGELEKAEIVYRRALKIDQEALGKMHSENAITLENLALLKIKQGKPAEALELARQMSEVQEHRLAEVLSFTSERQRLAFRKTISPYRLFATLGDGQSLAQTLLRQKGLVLDSLLEDRLVGEASADLKKRALVQQLRDAKERLAQLSIETPADESARGQQENEKEKLSGEVERLEATLAREVIGLGRSRRALGVTVSQVQSALSKNSALIEFVLHEFYEGKKKDELRYGAVVIGPSSATKWVPLGNADKIDNLIQLYQKSARGQTDEATLTGVLTALREQIWTPIENALPAGTTGVIISPDAQLNFISFATFLEPDNRFVSEKYSVRYVASGRDLIRENKSTQSAATSLFVFANPNFGSFAGVVSKPASNAVAMRSIDLRELKNISLPSLPGTEKEAAELRQRAQRHGWQENVALGSDASEAQLRRIKSPRILHLATHGFFLPENQPTESSNGSPKGKLLNPMLRSGIALAGAQKTLRAWARGETPPADNDGIVTAEEVGGLKLDATWLVVLSACDTGSGEARAGEGVIGLRRGFIQAGAQNLLMTLWPISDETTVQIMLDFYDAAFKTGNAPQALADTERDWLVKLRKERGLLPAVQLAGPFIMSSQGKP